LPLAPRRGGQPIDFRALNYHWNSKGAALDVDKTLKRPKFTAVNLDRALLQNPELRPGRREWHDPQRVSAAHAQDLQAVVTGMRACAAEQNDARRLVCYDKQFRQGALTPARADPATAPDAASSGSSAAPSAGPPAISAAPASLTPEQRFGLNAQLERKEHGTATQPPQLDKLSSRIAAVSYKLRGEAVVTSNMLVMEQGFSRVQEIKYGTMEDPDRSSMRNPPVRPHLSVTCHVASPNPAY